MRVQESLSQQGLGRGCAAQMGMPGWSTGREAPSGAVTFQWAPRGREGATGQRAERASQLEGTTHSVSWQQGARLACGTEQKTLELQSSDGR